MKSKKVKKLVVSLIKDDLVSRKLLSGLDGLGLNPLDYNLNLSDTIFSLMGFSDNSESEKIFEHYLNLAGKAKFLTRSKIPFQLDKLANEIYLELSFHYSTLKN